MEKETIQNYLNDYPEIVYDGINRNISGPTYNKEREQLFNATDEIQKCIDWLGKFFKPNKTMSNPSSSLQLKPYVENYFETYISNGSFIAAVKILGYDYLEFSDDESIYLSFNKLQRRKYKKEYLKS